MALFSRFRIGLFIVAILAQLMAGVTGIWHLARLSHPSEAARECMLSLVLMDKLNAELTDAERLVLFSVIHGSKAHPGYPLVLRKCLNKASEKVQLLREIARTDSEDKLLERLRLRVEDMEREGITLIEASAEKRWSLYVAPETGFQMITMSARGNLVTFEKWKIRAEKESDEASRFAGQRAIFMVAALMTGSLLLSLGAAWKSSNSLKHATPSVARARDSHPMAEP